MKGKCMGRVAAVLGFAVLVSLGSVSGCGGGAAEREEFYTSGSREADQRAEQRMAREEQLGGPDAAKNDEGQPKGPGGAEVAPKQVTLYERLGGEQGIQAIVNDFVDRVLEDPRVNWARKDVGGGGLIDIGTGPTEWEATPANVERLKRHMAQFFALATGGPTKYDGRNMREVHEGMRITNAEFDAVVGDLQATLDKLQVPNQEQKELLAVVESTREQVAEER